ncbi:hypothetical protein GF373_14970, partial [bacterium]|nr:hypothetical protein [bacterium]
MRTISIVDVRIEYENHDYRTPLKFGGVVTDKVTLLNVYVRVKDSLGKEMEGFGSMPMGNVWAFPTKNHSYNETLDAMKALATEIGAITKGYPDSAHPVDINVALEPMYLERAVKVQNERQLLEPIPKLCTLVVASPFDAAVHDAYGKLFGISSYQTYSADYMPNDLSHYLDESFAGEYLQQYVLTEPKPKMPLYHLVGAVDPLSEADIEKRKNDGLPETLPEWIRHDGLTHLKIKLN